jgi:hypothetical protein
LFRTRSRAWSQPGNLAGSVGIGEGLDADDSCIADGQERGPGLVNFKPVRATNDAHDDGHLISCVAELQGFDPVRVPSRDELALEPSDAIKAAVPVDGQ